MASFDDLLTVLLLLLYFFGKINYLLWFEISAMMLPFYWHSVTPECAVFGLKNWYDRNY